MRDYTDEPVAELVYTPQKMIESQKNANDALLEWIKAKEEGKKDAEKRILADYNDYMNEVDALEALKWRGMGLPNWHIAKAIGITESELMEFVETHPGLKLAWEKEHYKAYRDLISSVMGMLADGKSFSGYATILNSITGMLFKEIEPDTEDAVAVLDAIWQTGEEGNASSPEV